VRGIQKAACSLAVLAAVILPVVPQHAAAQAPTVVSYPPAFDEPIPLHEHLGHFSRSITTKAPEAQAFFDQGIRLIYSFSMQEAARSFREAQKRDSACAMCFFGEAWAWGPYLNGA